MKKNLFKNFLGIKLEQCTFIALGVYLTLILFSVPTDFNGDPNDYIRMARELFSTEIFSNFNRFIGYPIFIKFTSLNLAQLNLTFVCQLVILLFSLRYFAQTVSDDPFIRVLMYLPAFLPAIAYLPKLLFPDSLLLSLFLLFCSTLLRRHFVVSGVIIIAMTLIKLVFVFGILFWFAILVSRLFPYWKNSISVVYAAFLLLLMPTVFFVAPFSLYQTTIQNPLFVLDHEAPNPLPVDKNTSAICNNKPFILLDVVTSKEITEHSSDALFMPLGQQKAVELGCSQSDIKKIQRQLIYDALVLDPKFHFVKFIKRFGRDIFVFPDAQHLWWMLDTKLHMQVNADLDNAFYSPSELAYFQSQGIKPLKQPNLRLLASLVSLNPIIEKILSYFILVALCVGVLFLLKLRTVPPRILIVLGLLTSYNFMITFFAFGYDRYLVANYFLWFGVIAICLESIRKFLQHGSTYT